jgi:excinuclease UvrABC nuclease subunit
MAIPAEIFHDQLDFDPAGDLDAFVKSAPAKWAVYLMADAADQPIQLLCVKNLRASLKRRLGGQELIGVTKKLNYREIVRRIYWRRVDSAFEAVWVYLQAAREIFPATYRGMTGFRPAWFIHVNPQTTWPRYIKTINLTARSGIYLGPMEDKHSAQKLVHLIESLFDLCRDYSILTQSPNAGPCPWKQMRKCVGPCDGTISLEAYRELIAFSARVLADPATYLEKQTSRMKEAAAELRFERAQKIKTHLDQLSQLGKGPYRHLRPLAKFAFLSLQRGPWAGTARVFLITPGQIDEIADLVEEPEHASDLLRLVLDRAHAQEGGTIDDRAAEAIAVVSHHLFVARQKQGVFIQLDELEDRTLAKAYRDLMNQKQQEEQEGEGVTRELQAM